MGRDSNDPASANAILLLCEVLHKADIFLPPGHCTKLHVLSAGVKSDARKLLPSLVNLAASFSDEARSKASKVLKALRDVIFIWIASYLKYSIKKKLRPGTRIGRFVDVRMPFTAQDTISATLSLAEVF